jgi:hypothetical protein
MVVHKDPEGSPAYLWLYDDDGCPRRSRAEEVRSADSVTLDLATLRAAVERVYPLGTAAQVRLYEAIGLPQRDHETALALVAPFCCLEDDVLVLTAELYTGSHPVPLRAFEATLRSGIGSGDVLEIADRLFEAAASARTLVH